MSLHTLAQNLASKGRNGDSVLVHMTPREVGGLQALAMAQGGSLTINPDTGLPEANFLKRLLPTLIGAGLTFFSGGAINPLTAGAIVGGFEGVRTGDLGKGIMAGLGAFGGAGLGGALTGAGSIGAQAAGQTAAGQSIMEQAAAQGIASSEIAREMGTNFINPAVSSGFAPQAGAEAAKQAAMKNFASQGLGQQLQGSYSAAMQPGGLGSLSSNLMGQYGGKYGAMAAAYPTMSELAMATAPKPLNVPEPEKSKYAGPYTPTSRQVRFRSPLDTSTSEFEYFTPSNPIPFADGGALGGAVGLTDRESNYDETYEGGGLAALAGGGLTAFAGGKFLQGPGDGTSDSIPAVIGNKQPARLADGEFVIDARTVSELGNGSSKAGAQKLYKMMDRVHAARKKAGRGKDSGAEKYLPA